MREVETLVQLFETSCSRRADAPLFGTRKGASFEWTSYAEIHRRVARMRQLLLSLGVSAGDRVALIADNSEQWAVICYATFSVGAVFVPMYTSQHAADWEFILQDCDPTVVFIDVRKTGKAFDLVRSRLTSVQQVIAIDGDVADSLTGRLARLQGKPTEPLAVNPDDPACYVYTSGTMGRPKGVILTHRSIVHNVKAAVSLFSLTEEDRSLAFLPWAHAFGQTVDLHVMIYVGCQVALNGEISALLTNLTLAQPTILIAVPRVFCRLHDAVRKQIAQRARPIRVLFQRGLVAAARREKGRQLSLVQRLWLAAADRLIFHRVRARFGGRLRLVVCGSAALSQNVAEFINAIGIEFYEGYGLTETSPIVSFNNPHYRRFGTVGKPLPGVTVRIDKSVGPDPDTGEILVKGPIVMAGYHNLPAETARVLSAEGEFRTGDLGRLDEEGYLIVTGRLKEQFKLANGRYVTPAPIEEKVKESSLIANCMLYGADEPYCVLLVVPESSALEKLKKTHGTAFADTKSDPSVHRLLKRDIASLLTDFTAFARPKKLLLLEEDFTIENGLLTPSQKVRRHAVVQRYRDRLQGLYADTQGVERAAAARC